MRSFRYKHKSSQNLWKYFEKNYFEKKKITLRFGSNLKKKICNNILKKNAQKIGFL